MKRLTMVNGTMGAERSSVQRVQRMKKAYLPNLITLCRVILSLGLLLIDFQSIFFIPAYLLCGLTDILDGFIARKTDCETPSGAKLDSIADLFMCWMIFLTIIRQNRADSLVFAGISIIFMIRIGNAVFSKLKFGKMASIHTIANKLSGLLFFFCPLAYYALFGNTLLFITGLFAFLSASEEFLILFTAENLDPNRKSIFSRR